MEAEAAAAEQYSELRKQEPDVNEALNYMDTMALPSNQELEDEFVKFLELAQRLDVSKVDSDGAADDYQQLYLQINAYHEMWRTHQSDDPYLTKALFLMLKEVQAIEGLVKLAEFKEEVEMEQAVIAGLAGGGKRRHSSESPAEESIFVVGESPAESPRKRRKN